MKLTDLEHVMAGTRAIKRVDFPLVNVPGHLQADQPEMAEQRARNTEAVQPGQAPPAVPPTVEVGLRVLTGEETATVYEKAWAAAKARGSEKPDESDPSYALMLSVWTLALACVDPDSDPERPALFFGKNPDEAARNVLASPHIGRDGIAYLCEQHEAWQDLCNPQAKNVDTDTMWAVISEAVASGDPGPFLKMRLGLRQSCMLFMASQLVDLLAARSSSGSPTGTGGATSTRSGES